MSGLETTFAHILIAVAVSLSQQGNNDVGMHSVVCCLSQLQQTSIRPVEDKKKDRQNLVDEVGFHDTFDQSLGPMLRLSTDSEHALTLQLRLQSLRGVRAVLQGAKTQQEVSRLAIRQLATLSVRHSAVINAEQAQADVNVEATPPPKSFLSKIRKVDHLSSVKTTSNGSPGVMAATFGSNDNNSSNSISNHEVFKLMKSNNNSSRPVSSSSQPYANLNENNSTNNLHYGFNGQSILFKLSKRKMDGLEKKAREGLRSFIKRNPNIITFLQTDGCKKLDSNNDKEKSQNNAILSNDLIDYTPFSGFKSEMSIIKTFDTSTSIDITRFKADGIRYLILMDSLLENLSEIDWNNFNIKSNFTLFNTLDNQFSIKSINDETIFNLTILVSIKDVFELILNVLNKQLDIIKNLLIEQNKKIENDNDVNTIIKEIDLFILIFVESIDSIQNMLKLVFKNNIIRFLQVIPSLKENNIDSIRYKFEIEKLCELSLENTDLNLNINKNSNKSFTPLVLLNSIFQKYIKDSVKVVKNIYNLKSFTNNKVIKIKLDTDIYSKLNINSLYYFINPIICGTLMDDDLIKDELINNNHSNRLDNIKGLLNMKIRLNGLNLLLDELNENILLFIDNNNDNNIDKENNYKNNKIITFFNFSQFQELNNNLNIINNNNRHNWGQLNVNYKSLLLNNLSKGFSLSLNKFENVNLNIDKIQSNIYVINEIINTLDKCLIKLKIIFINSFKRLINWLKLNNENSIDNMNQDIIQLKTDIEILLSNDNNYINTIKLKLVNIYKLILLNYNCFLNDNKDINYFIIENLLSTLNSMDQFYNLIKKINLIFQNDNNVENNDNVDNLLFVYNTFNLNKIELILLNE